MPNFARTGFTLIELLVVITIIGVLVGVGFANFQTFSATEILNDAVNQTQSILRTAQSNARDSIKCGHSSSPMAGWDITFVSDKDIQLGCDIGSSVVKEQDLLFNDGLNGVTIDSITTAGGCITGFPGNSFVAGYSRLYGKVSFNPCPGETSATVVLKYSKGSVTLKKNIVVSKGGEIDVQNN